MSEPTRRDVIFGATTTAVFAAGAGIAGAGMGYMISGGDGSDEYNNALLKSHGLDDLPEGEVRDKALSLAIRHERLKISFLSAGTMTLTAIAAPVALNAAADHGEKIRSSEQDASPVGEPA